MIKQQMMQLLRQKNIRCAEINEIAIEAYMPGKEMETVHCIIAFGVDQLSIVDVKCQNLFNFKENISGSIYFGNICRKSTYLWYKKS
jgi:hypothetical protein